MAIKNKVNVGQWDRALRIFAGLCLIAILFIEDSNWCWVGVLGIAYLYTGITRWCPAYTWMGISTCSANKSKE